MIGAILGDIIGSRFEFDRGGKTKQFELFTAEDYFTDDTVMTVAIAEALMNVERDADVNNIKESCIESMQRWGRKYPNAGYGTRFYHWVFSKNPKPYGSFGNGSAMRVSAAGWLYDTVERTREVARATAEVSHNHPEGIKGAECTAAVIFLSRNGSSKEEIKEYVVREFGYDLSKSVDELRPLHNHVETCMDSLPKALASFFEGDSYEDVVRNAVSLGGDTDTLAAIAGAMAEAFYDVPLQFIIDGSAFIPAEMLCVFSDLNVAKNGAVDEPDYSGTCIIKEAVEEALDGADIKNGYLNLCNILLDRMYDEAEAPTPVDDINNVMGRVDFNNVSGNTPFEIPEDLRMRIHPVMDMERKLWYPLFTDGDEIAKGETTNLQVNLQISEIVRFGAEDANIEGIVINPFGRAISVSKSILKIMIDDFDKYHTEE